MSKILIFLIIFINSLTVFSAETEEEILSKADQLYNEQLYADAIVEYNKLINSNSNFYKGNAYLGLADSNYWIENNEKLSLSFYDIVFENKLLLREINNSLKVTMYMRIAWLNDFISNYPYSFKFYSLSISTYEKYFNNKKDENSFSDYCVSLYNKGILFYEGTGTKQNFQKSFELFKKSSSLCEDSESMNYLGVMYEQGTGTEQNFTSAIEWYFKSMTMEIEPSLWSKINYAFLLANGYGIEKDLELAKSYLNEVINDEESLNYFDAYNVIEYAKDYLSTINDINLTNQNASLEYIDSFVCGDIYSLAIKGKDVTESFQRCLKVAADNNDPNAQFHIAKFYQIGIGVIKNIDIATYWYEKSSRILDIAKYNLAKIIQEGRTNLYETSKAIELFSDLIQNPKDPDNNFTVESNYELGIMYRYGVGTNKNLENAIKYFDEVLLSQNNYRKQAQKELDLIKAEKAGIYSPNNVVNFFPAYFEGSFKWENNSEIIEITDLKLEKITQVGVTNFIVEGNYVDDRKTKVIINGFLDSNYNSIEIWEKNPINIELNKELNEEEFITSGSYLGFINNDFTSLNAHWIPYGSGERGVLKLNRTNKIKKNIQNEQLINDINYGDYYALVIGNNNYKYMIPSLETAIADANSVSEVLKNKYNFKIIDTIIDGSYQEIMAAINNLKNIVGPYDNLLIYYAGHGHEDVNTGFWIPIDGADPIDDDDSYWISTDRISRAISKIPAKHILIVADSCYSGTLIDRGKKTQLDTDKAYFTNLLNLKVRRALTSGANEPVADGGGEGHSIFASIFLKILIEKNSVLTTTELYNELVRKVTNKVTQTPQYGKIGTDDEGGDFIFVPKN